jgi:hypothetical protein
MLADYDTFVVDVHCARGIPHSRSKNDPEPTLAYPKKRRARAGADNLTSVVDGKCDRALSLDRPKIFDDCLNTMERAVWGSSIRTLGSPGGGCSIRNCCECEHKS